MKKKMMKKVVVFALALMMVLTSVMIGGVEEAKAATPEEVTLENADFAEDYWNGWSATFSDNNWTDGTYNLYKDTCSAKEITVPEDATDDYFLNFWKKDASTIWLSQKIENLPAGEYTVSMPVMGKDASVSVSLGSQTSTPKALTGWGTWDYVTGTFVITEEIAEAYLTVNIVCSANGWGYLERVDFTGETIVEDEYTVTVTPTTASVEKGNAVTLTAKVLKGSTEVEDLTAEGLTLSWAVDTTGTGHTDGKSDATLSSTTGNSITVTPQSAGKYYVGVELEGEPINAQTIEYAIVTSTEPAAQTPNPDDYTFTITPDKESVVEGGTIKLTATVTKDGQPVTDLEANGLHVWWSHNWDSGNQDADYDSTNSRSLTCDVKLNSVGEYYFIVKLEHQDGDVWTQIGETQYLTLTATEKNTTTEPKDEEDSKDEEEPKDEEDVVINVELKNTGFESALEDIWYGSAVDGTWEDATQYEKIDYTDSRVNGISKPENAGNSLLKFNLASGDQIDIVQWVEKLPAGTYTITAPVMGNNAKVQFVLGTSENPSVKGSVQLDGWNSWKTAKATFVVKEDMYNVQIGFRLTATEPADSNDQYSWGYIDNINVKAVPNTGDTTNVYAYVLLMMAGLAVVGYTVKRNKVQF